MKLKTLLTTLVITFALAFVPFCPALCEDTSSEASAEAGEADSADGSVEGETERDAPPEALSLMDIGDEIDEGSVGKAQLLSPLLSESFQTDLATGAATVSVPIVVPPGRKNMQPNLGLSYSSNNPNGVCGVGWALTGSSIQRSTKKGPPKYDNTDTFVFSSSGSSGELVNIGDTEYRQKIETAFMKYEYDGAIWTVRDKNGTKYTFGSSAGSQNADPGDSAKIFAWYLESVEDVYGNYLTYIYGKPGDGQIYLEEVQYTGNTDLTPDKSIIFEYEENRADRIYNYRSGWEIETSRLLKEIHVNVDSELKWKYVLDYTPSVDTSRLLLTKVTLFDADGNSLPPKQFTYQTIE